MRVINHDSDFRLSSLMNFKQNNNIIEHLLKQHELKIKLDWDKIIVKKHYDGIIPSLEIKSRMPTSLYKYTESDIFKIYERF